MSACRSCGAAIVWLTLRPGGKRMPVDLEPADDGNVLADLDQAVGMVVPESELGWMKEQTPEERFYRSHFATCPDAEKWRRRRS